MQQLKDEDPIDLAVYDVTGKLIYKSQSVFTNRSASLSLTDIAPGFYCIRINDISGMHYTLSFIKK